MTHRFELPPPVVGNYYTFTEVKAFCRTQGISCTVKYSTNEIRLNYAGGVGTEDTACYIDRGYTGESLQDAYKEAMATAYAMTGSYLENCVPSPGARRSAQIHREPAYYDAQKRVSGKMTHTNWQELLRRNQ